ncbi:anti-sigma factor domain-containing protein [Hazenella sp. IB182353]|uniref:anti-sigma factor domain-containing protein n=1 Tax=Polycladospora coralii TaxID=2771432 RepID=UPI001745FCB6|nr:anti-sigma factor domain-containing protein [Polycladospora coralii]MBS7531228.1 anti-sigma factor domain-containing protein [Polycladospora coralii]
MKAKGIIMEIKGKHYIVLTPDGNFVTVPRQRFAQLGEEIEIVQEERRKFPRPSLVFKGLSIATAVMIGLFLIIPGFFSNEQVHASSYIYLDVQPSIEIEIDDENQIRNVKPLNKEAEQILKKIDWKDDGVEDFAIVFLKTYKETGKVLARDQVVVSGISDADEKKPDLDEVQSSIQKKIENEKELGLSVHTLNAPTDLKKGAKETGISPTTYLMYVMAKKEGKVKSIEEIDDKSIAEWTADSEQISEVIKNPPSSEHEWEELISKDEIEETAKEIKNEQKAGVTDLPNQDASEDPKPEEPNTSEEVKTDVKQKENTTEPANDPVVEPGESNQPHTEEPKTEEPKEREPEGTIDPVKPTPTEPEEIKEKPNQSDQTISDDPIL